MSHKHESLLRTIFHDPISGNIHWREVESLLHHVGADIEPGTYRSAGTDTCYWARLSGTSGNFEEIIANNFGAGQQVVTIDPSDAAFETTMCGSWEKIS